MKLYVSIGFIGLLGTLWIPWTTRRPLDTFWIPLATIPFCILENTWTPGIDLDSLYSLKLMIKTWTHGIVLNSFYGLGLMVTTLTHATDFNFVLFNQKIIRGPSFSHKQDFSSIYWHLFLLSVGWITT